jgi:hypothetical protein
MKTSLPIQKGVDLHHTIWELAKKLFDPISIFRSILFSILIRVAKRYRGAFTDFWKNIFASTILYSCAGLGAFFHVASARSSLVKASLDVYHRINDHGLSNIERLIQIGLLVMWNEQDGAIPLHLIKFKFDSRRLLQFHSRFSYDFFRWLSFPISTLLAIIYGRYVILVRRKSLSCSPETF